MGLRVAIQMDPIAGINPRSDSTLVLMLEAQARGHSLFYYTPDTLTYRDGRITAHASLITVYDALDHYYDLGTSQLLDLADMDVVLLRQDPPYDMHYLTTTYLLEMLPKRVRIVNNPTSVRNFPEKIFPMLLREFMPPTLVSANPADIAAFHREQGDIVMKPLYGFGGHEVVKIQAGDAQLTQKLEAIFATAREPIMAQRFLPEVTSADRRIIIMNGEVAGIFGRIPASGEIRANMRVGGTPVAAEITPKQRKICEAFKPLFQKHGLVFVGLDVIGDYLTEINITSPTGLRAVKMLYGTKPEALFWDAVEEL